MDARVSLVTLGVADLARSLAFYRDGLGWRPASASVGDVVFFQAGGVVLALYPRRLLADDARLDDTAPAGAFGGFALAHNVRTRHEVDRTLDEVASAGGRILKPAEDASWGGRSGYFADPDGHPWEVAWNPSFTMEADGTIRLT
jgi:hypothetical protein